MPYAKLFNYIEMIRENPTKQDFLNILNTLDEKYEDLEWNEPESDSARVKWEEKLDELADVYDAFVDLYNANELNEQDLRLAIRDLKLYQYLYSGLKRLEVEYDEEGDE